MRKTIIPPTPSQADYTQAEHANDGRDFPPLMTWDNPIALFEDWMSRALETEINDSNAMSLATVDGDGQPDVRIVLLKSLDEQGFVFYTNANSAKGEQLRIRAKAALCFHWKTLKLQVRVRGHVEAVSAAESDTYFASRSRGSQIGAWASDQSAIVASRAVLQERVEAVEAEYADQPITRPPHWYGWRVVPQTFEFWRDRPFRLHDRIVFTRQNKHENKHKNKHWQKARLYP